MRQFGIELNVLNFIVELVVVLVISLDFENSPLFKTFGYFRVGFLLDIPSIQRFISRAKSSRPLAELLVGDLALARVGMAVGQLHFVDQDLRPVDQCFDVDESRSHPDEPTTRVPPARSC